MRCSRAVSAVSVASGVVVLLGEPAAAAQPSAHCAFRYAPAVSPGLTAETSSGEVSSGGESGIVFCRGGIDGHEITGPGTFGFEGVYDRASCVEGGEGSGRVLFTVPTTAGDHHYDEAIDFAFGVTGGFPPGVGDWQGDRTTGLYLVVPVEGDCVTAPVTRVAGIGQFTLRG